MKRVYHHGLLKKNQHIQLKREREKNWFIHVSIFYVLHRGPGRSSKMPPKEAIVLQDTQSTLLKPAVWGHLYCSSDVFADMLMKVGAAFSLACLLVWFPQRVHCGLWMLENGAGKVFWTGQYSEINISANNQTHVYLLSSSFKDFSLTLYQLCFIFYLSVLNINFI